MISTATTCRMLNSRRQRRTISRMMIQAIRIWVMIIRLMPDDDR